MVHTQIDIVYGVLVTIGDLLKLGYLKPEDELRCIEEFSHRLNGRLSYIRAWHHSWVDNLEMHHPDRLPPVLRAARMKSEETPDSDDEGEFPHKRALMCVGVTIGTVELTRWIGIEVPQLAKFNEAAQEFEKLAPKELLELAGPAELQFIPNDCCCCT